MGLYNFALTVVEPGTEVFRRIDEAKPTPKRPEALEEFAFLLDEPKRFARELIPIHWRDLASATGGIPSNVWCGVEVRDESDIEKVAQLRQIRSRWRFLVIKCNDDVIEKLIPHLEAWRCMNCGKRGEAPRPDSCGSKLCIGAEWKIQPQIHWAIGLSQELCQRYGISSTRPLSI